MAAKKIKAKVKLLIKAGQATPQPPIGSTLGPHGLNLAQFCKEVNAQTASMQGMVPLLVTVFEDRTYEFLVKTPPVAELIKQTLKIEKGSANSLKEKVATMTMEQAQQIAQKKMVDLNNHDLQGATNQVLGTAKSMGIKITQ
jgi:large subunit ribosomal protein L11